MAAGTGQGAEVHVVDVVTLIYSNRPAFVSAIMEKKHSVHSIALPTVLEVYFSISAIVRNKHSIA